MTEIKDILEKATIRGMADYLLYGYGANEDDRSYEERLDEPYMRFKNAVEKYDSSSKSELLDLVNMITSETASVYTEIGLQAGVLLMIDILSNTNKNKIDSLKTKMVEIIKKNVEK